MFDFLKNIGSTELIIIAVILLFFFGGKKIKELSRGLGESVKEIKGIKNELKGSPPKKEKKEA